MIIDLILDRKYDEDNGYTDSYDANKFYHRVLDYYDITPENVDDITSAMDSGTEEDVKTALKNYIDDNDYAHTIKDYIDSVDWLGEEE